MDSGQVFIAWLIAPAVLFCLVGVVVSAIMAWWPAKPERRVVAVTLRHGRAG